MKKMIGMLFRVALIAFALYLIVVWVIVPMFKSRETIPPFTDIVPRRDCSERVYCIDDNEDALIRRFQVIEHAQKELIFTSYNMKDDESGEDMMAAILNAADRGVNVRVMVDGLCVLSNLHKSEAFQALACAENVEIKVYNPIGFGTLHAVNYRMHDKYIIADDDLYLLGGRNTHNVSLGKYTEDPDIDRDLLVYNAAPDPQNSIQQVKDYFESVWSLETTRPVQGRENPDALQKLRGHYSIIASNAADLLCEPNWEDVTVPTEGVTLLTNSVKPTNKAPILWTHLCALMQTGNDIVVQTPYIVCDKHMYGDLTALAETGRIRMITNDVSVGANFSGCVDYMNQKNRILKTGAEIYEGAFEHSCHAKTVLIDEKISVVGSFNFDMRSAYLDTEMMLVIQSEELNAHLRKVCGNAMEQSLRVLPDGTEICGSSYKKPVMSGPKKVLYTVLRAVILPFRHLI